MESTDEALNTRASYTQGLRELADIIDANPHLTLPHHGTTTPLGVYVTPKTPESQRKRTRDWSRALPGQKRKQHRGSFFCLEADIAGLRFEVVSVREAFCRKIETQETITEEVPVYPTEPTGFETIERTVSHVEWVCDEAAILGTEGEQRDAAAALAAQA